MNGTLSTATKDDRLQRRATTMSRGLAAVPTASRAHRCARYGLLSGDLTGDGITVPGAEGLGPCRYPLHLSRLFPHNGRRRCSLGRDFADADTGSAPLVVIVNRAFATKAFGTDTAIGRTLQLDNKTATVSLAWRPQRCFDDIRTPPPRALATLPVPTAWRSTFATFALRTAGNPADLIPMIEKRPSRASPRRFRRAVRTQEQQIQDAVRRERLFASLVSGFAVVGALLACRRDLRDARPTRWRAARPRSGSASRSGRRVRAVVWLILRGVRLAGRRGGPYLGPSGALALTRLIDSMLFGLTPQDPVTYAVAAALLLASAIVAAWIPSAALRNSIR